MAFDPMAFDPMASDPMAFDSMVAEPIYKGATRPPTIFGVPLLAFLLLAGCSFLAGMYLLVYVSALGTAAVAAVALALLAWMRGITRKDDQRLAQALIAAKLALQCPNRRFWRCRSYSPLAYRGARDAWRH
jgi:type IV secretion system protein VirB3